MADPLTLAITGYIAKNAPHWLDDLRTTLFSKGKDLVTERGKGWLDEKQQQHHLQHALENAFQRALEKLPNRQERDNYKDILTNLFEPGAHSDSLRRAAMTYLSTLSDTPDFAELNAMYNQSLRTRNLSQNTTVAEIDTTPYLIAFFDALRDELYADSFFKEQISENISIRAARSTQQSTADAAETLHEIHETIKNEYTQEQFQQDIETYARYIERAFRNLKIIGFLPKDQNTDPELNGIYVPQRIALSDRAGVEEQESISLASLLTRYPYMVLLGDPGSGKSTLVRHLAWSHARANIPSSDTTDASLLPRDPLPVRIELRLLTQDRKSHPDYSFLSYATEVLLGRENIKVNERLFHNLLAQKRLLLLFDGLDEVTTLDERKRLVEEIEHFAQLYPGNYILVTSRPVGYELASCNKQLFVHAQIQNFNDEQIHDFLQRWYTHVMGLSPIPYQEQQELEALFSILKENPRLHRLAENPLLLTVITALYRSQRLPEKRVQVYERCAELLLETWAKLKGTDQRWAEMKMSKDDQAMCVAHLGFNLHQRSQEQNDDDTRKTGRPAKDSKDTATDVPERKILREIETFLRERKLISELAGQRKEAELFLQLMQVEAGLIVERGTNENGENLYGFVHRTFQEYFAAADVHARYREEEDSTIIDTFLAEHLHDPHWREVILLLLSKLGRKPITLRLRQLLDGKIKPRRSLYTHILQHDLFFAADCLIEELPLEPDLAQDIITRLSNVAITSPFSSQRNEVLGKLGKLLKTKQYDSIAQGELVKLATLDSVTDVSLRIRIAEALYVYSPGGSEEKKQGVQILRELARHVGLSVEERIQAAEALYRSSRGGSEEKKQGAQILEELARHVGLSAGERIRTARALYRSSLDGSEEKKQGAQILEELAQRSDLEHNQRLYIATIPIKQYNVSYADKIQAFHKLSTLLSEDELTKYIDEHWDIEYMEMPPAEIPFMIEALGINFLPSKVKESIYSSLEFLIPNFDKIPT